MNTYFILMQNDTPLGVYSKLDLVKAEVKKIKKTLQKRGYGEKDLLTYYWTEEYQLNTGKKVGYRAYFDSF